MKTKLCKVIGAAALVEECVAPGFGKDEVHGLVASVEIYSKHPLARAITAAA